MGFCARVLGAGGGFREGEERELIAESRLGEKGATEGGWSDGCDHGNVDV